MSRDAIARYLEADVLCYHCGHGSGVVRRDRGAPHAPLLFREHTGVTRIVQRMTDLYCSRCRGSVYADAFEVRYVYPRVGPGTDGPRRGRPTKWPAEQRPTTRQSA
jgi:hypothetical protein